MTAQTPEGRVKDKVKRILKRPGVYSFWPVQTGMGGRTLDCLGWHRGRAFAIECKAPGKKLTPAQEIIRDDMAEAGGVVFEISGEPEQYALLERWLD